MNLPENSPRIQNLLKQTEIPRPAFLEKAKDFREPFDKEGLPRRYLALLIPLLGGGITTREEMLRSARYAECNKGYLSSTFAAFGKLGIAQYDQTAGVWHQGPNYMEFMSWVFRLSMQNEAIRGRWTRVLRLGIEDKTVDYILDLEEEDQGRSK